MNRKLWPARCLGDVEFRQDAEQGVAMEPQWRHVDRWLTTPINDL